MKKYYKRWLKSLGVLERVEELNVNNYEKLYQAFIWSATVEGLEYWIELDTRIRYFEILIERVAVIDKKAAKYLKKDMWKTVESNPTITASLGGAMVWANTPQGWKYWDIIDQQLEDY